MGLIGDKGYHAADESPDAKAQRAYQQHLHDNWDDCDMDPEDVELEVKDEAVNEVAETVNRLIRSNSIQVEQKKEAARAQ